MTGKKNNFWGSKGYILFEDERDLGTVLLLMRRSQGEKMEVMELLLFSCYVVSDSL